MEYEVDTEGWNVLCKQAYNITKNNSYWPKEVAESWLEVCVENNKDKLNVY